MSDDVYRTKFTRRITWDEDTMKVSDSVTDVWNDAVSNIRDGLDKQMEDAVCNHFDIDMSDLRAYMHDKIAWERKQELAIPKWIPVTERLPEAEDHYLAAYRYPGCKDISYGILYYGFMDFKPEEGMCFYKYESEWGDVRYDNVTHWMKIPEPPKEEDDG